MRFTRPLIALAITASVVAASGVTAAGADLEANATGARLSGPDRYATSAQVADQICAQGSPVNFIIASGAGFPDALSASALAGQLGNSAILLTDPNTLRPSTQAELRHARGSCGIASITIVGGTAAVSAGVQASLAGFGAVTRISGPNRYATAIAISQQVANEGNAVLLATGENFPDALSGGVLAYAGPHALLLNNGTSLRTDVRDYLINNGVTQVIVLGGTAAVPASVFNQIRQVPGVTQAERLSGTDRYGTAVSIANFLQSSGSIAAGNVLLADGLAFPDALSASAYGGATGSPILLTTPTALSTPTRNYLQSRSGGIGQITAIGGTAAVSNATLNAAITAAGGTAPPVPPPSPIFTLRSGTVSSGPVGPDDTQLSVVLDFNRRVLLPTNLAGITLSGGSGGLATTLSATTANVAVTPDGFGLTITWLNPDQPVEVLTQSPQIQVAANTIFDTDNDPLAPTTRNLQPGGVL